MAGYIYAGGWKTLQKGFIYANGAWRTVQKGFVYANGAWRQFFASATTTYTFSLGNTVHLGTNGYISLDTGQSTSSISSTVGRVLGILPANLVTNSIRWAADSSKFYVFYRGRRSSSATDFEIEYEVHFTDGLNYALIKLVAFPADTYSNTAYYYDGSRTGFSAITSARTVGAEYRVYFGATAAFATSFTEYGVSTHPVWLASSTPTSGTLDTGYFTIVASQGSSAQAPTPISSSSVTGTTATVSWTAPSNANSGMSAIQSYDYSIDSGANWISTGASTSVNLISLTSNTSYTVLVRANNYFFTGTNYASVTFTTANVPGTPTITYSSVTATGFTATWAATGATTYNVDAFRSVSGAALTDTGGFTYPRNGTSATSATFTGLTGTLSHTVSVAGVNSGGTGPTFSKTLAGTPAVTFGTNTSTATGFTGSISNYDSSYTYTASATNSATVTFGSVSGSTYNFTVSGLSAGTSSTVTITAAKATAFNGTGSTTGTATVAVPGTPTITFSSITATGFTASWTATGATTYNVDAFRSVSGAALTDTGGFVYPRNGTSATTATFTSLTGTLSHSMSVAGINSSGTGASASKTMAGTPAVTFGTNTGASTTSFTGSVTNYNNTYTYTYTATNSATLTWGTPSGSTYPFTVTGLSSGGSSTVTVTASKDDAFNGTGSTTGTATSPNVAPTGGTVSIALTSGTSGRVGAVFTATVTNASGTPTPTYTYSWRRSINYSPFTVTTGIGTSSTYTVAYADVDSTIDCVVTFTNGISPNQTATSGSLSVSPPTITAVRATTTNNTAPYCTWEIIGYNIQSSQGTVKYGTTSSVTITSGTDPQANTGLTRATTSRSGTAANFYRYDSIRAFSGTSQTGRPSPSAAAIASTTVVQANTAQTTTVYGTFP